MCVYVCVSKPASNTLITWDSLLVFLHVGVGPEELGEGSVVVDQFSVAADLGDPALVHHNDLVALWEEPYAVGHQDTHLGGKGEEGGERGEGRGERGGGVTMVR